LRPPPLEQVVISRARAVKTTALDGLLIGSCVLALVALSTLTVLALPSAGTYRVIIDAAVFLLAYGVYTMILLALLRKRWPYPHGTFSMDSGAFTWWKLNAVLVDLASKALSPYRLVFTESLLHAGFGATVRSQTAIAGVLRDHPMLEIDERATIGQNSVITAHAITGDVIVIKPIRIGRSAVVGVNCVVMPGVELGDHAVLAPGAVAIVDTKIPANELWGGIPARKIR